MTIRTSNSRTNPDNSNYHGIELISPTPRRRALEGPVMRDLELCNEIARIISDCIGAEDLDQEVAKIIMQKKEEIRFKIAVYIPIIIPPGNAEGAVKNSLIQLSNLSLIHI